MTKTPAGIPTETHTLPHVISGEHTIDVPVPEKQSLAAMKADDIIERFGDTALTGVVNSTNSGKDRPIPNFDDKPDYASIRNLRFGPATIEDRPPERRRR